MSLFRPNVEKLAAKGDIAGLVKALAYERDPQIAPAAATALVAIGAPRSGRSPPLPGTRTTTPAGPPEPRSTGECGVLSGS